MTRARSYINVDFNVASNAVSPDGTCLRNRRTQRRAAAILDGRHCANLLVVRLHCPASTGPIPGAKVTSAGEDAGRFNVLQMQIAPGECNDSADTRASGCDDQE